jgi:hypothetical protein
MTFREHEHRLERLRKPHRSPASEFATSVIIAVPSVDVIVSEGFGELDFGMKIAPDQVVSVSTGYAVISFLTMQSIVRAKALDTIISGTPKYFITIIGTIQRIVTRITNNCRHDIPQILYLPE